MMVAVHQPQYLPWLGYFDKIAAADVFVLLDNVQFKKNEWQNRNRIKTAAGPQWLTVPVRYKFPERINEVSVNNQEHWVNKHRQAIVTNYRKAPCWDEVSTILEPIFAGSWESISQLNIFTVKLLAKTLGIETPLYVASELPPFPEDPDLRLIAIAKHFAADTYLAGKGGIDYMNLACFRENGVRVKFQQYNHPVYRQLFNGFEPFMSVIDLLFNYGEDSLKILRG
ncbi:MAG: WbqC family protein [Syntrophales bacterium]